MGKRKRHSDEGIVENGDMGVMDLDSTASSSGWREEARPKAKKRREKHSAEEAELINNDVPLTNGGSLHLNGHLPEKREREEDRVAWLIRKPINVPIEDLYNLRFSRKQKCQHQELIASTDQRRLECRLEKPACMMVHAIEREPAVYNQKAVMQSNDSLRGILWISQSKSEEDNEQVHQPTSPSSDAVFLGNLQEPGNAADIVDHIEIAPIRRRPQLEEEGLKERLRAYGRDEKEAIRKREEEEDDNNEREETEIREKKKSKKHKKRDRDI